MPIEDPLVTPKAQYNALNGEELRYVILRELDRKLGEYDEFRGHLTYSKFLYVVEVQVALDAYPLSSTVKASVLAQGQQPPDYKPEPGVEPKRFKFHFGTSKPVLKPDLLRQEAGLPIPKTTPTGDGQIVDKLVEQKTPDLKPPQGGGVL